MNLLVLPEGHILNLDRFDGLLMLHPSSEASGYPRLYAWFGGVRFDLSGQSAECLLTALKHLRDR